MGPWIHKKKNVDIASPYFTLHRLRELELKAEDLERKVKTLETANDALETKLEETNADHQKIKDELEETLKAMDDM